MRDDAERVVTRWDATVLGDGLQSPKGRLRADMGLLNVRYSVAPDLADPPKSAPADSESKQNRRKLLRDLKLFRTNEKKNPQR